MTEAVTVEQPARRPVRWLPLVMLLLITFALGIAAAGWALANSPQLRARVIGAPEVVTQRVMVPSPVPVVAPAIRQVASRLGTLENRVEEVDAQSRAVVGNVDRAEGLLIAFAARRALDRGLELGYLETSLRDHFGERDPQAVAAIITASRKAVTLEDLRTGLNDLPAAELVAAPEASWFEAMHRALGDIVHIRREGAISTAPIDRLARARKLIDDGRVDRALAEVSRLPGRDKAGAWIAQARRYISARAALDRLELASLMKPAA